MDLALLGQAPTQELPPGVLAIGESDLTLDPTSLVYPGVTFDLEQGPVVIGERATVRPGASIAGPAYVGPHATVMDRALIKPHTAIGPWCKVAGEVGGTILQGYSNKAHDGHLGDSWIGEWVNLGAGTTNSNLLNTYAEVIARGQPGASNERTGLQFLGAIIGDHVKTAICTRLMTGCVLHTGSMFAETRPVSGCVAGFTWATDEGRKVYRFEKFMEVARAMMARRKVEASGVYEACLKGLQSSPSGG
jgi:UDP-N-acetylglucosamine diphosphorylase/glucosamine-1-phosphate N-acetyltransferase